MHYLGRVVTTSHFPVSLGPILSAADLSLPDTELLPLVQCLTLVTMLQAGLVPVKSCLAGRLDALRMSSLALLGRVASQRVGYILAALILPVKSFVYPARLLWQLVYNCRLSYFSLSSSVILTRLELFLSA